MLRNLKVLNLAVVERAEAEFGPSLNVITGETGAGKSVLMGALDLVLGGRADASIVRDGASEAEVEAVFESAEGKRTVIRRTLTTEGRSRVWVNDETVSVAELKTLGSTLVDIHGPTANQRLVDENFQRVALDVFGDVKMGTYAETYAAYSEIKSQIASYSLGDEESAEEIADRVDLLRYQVNELQSADLCEDDETIAERHAAAAHAEEIVSAANEITEGLGGDRSAAEMLVALQPKFNAIARHMPSAAEWAAKAEELTLEIQELSRTIADAASRMDFGADDLDKLDARLTVINGLKRKYLRGADAEGRSDIVRLLEVLEMKEVKLDALEHREERIEELKGKLETLGKTLKTIGAKITKERAAAGEKLAKAVTKELKDLGFKQAKFSVRLDAVEPDRFGCDRVVFMFEPNPGESARSLATIASSGEIARVMLALKGILVAKDGAETLVFDEIDANIGGEVGRITGEKLRGVAEHHQVIAITHLPQSAVFGARHFVVSKSVAGGRTRTSIVPVEGTARVSEIARMLGGEKLTSVVRRHAEELLQLAAR